MCEIVVLNARAISIFAKHLILSEKLAFSFIIFYIQSCILYK